MQVIATDVALAKRVCAVVERAAPVFERCGLGQSRPVVIRIANEPTEMQLMGHYGFESNEIRLQAPKNLAQVLDDSSAYLKIAPEQLFESIVVHELTHAYFHNTRCGMETCLAGHEYIAYAMQFQTLSTQDRNALIDALPASIPVELEWFTDERLNETPELFAANAWRHFSRPGMGCAFVRDIVAGDAVFPSEFE